MKKAHQIVNNNLLPSFDLSTKYSNQSQTKSIKNITLRFNIIYFFNISTPPPPKKKKFYLDNNLKGNITRGRRKSHSAQFLVITVNYLLV